MIRIKRKRKNPNLKGEEFIDDKFLDLLESAFTTSSLGTGNKWISEALIYKNIGYNDCEDCSDEKIKRTYRECKCEYCEDCNYNYCVCNLDSFQKLRNYIIHLAIQYLNKKQLSKFLEFIIRTNIQTQGDYTPQIKLLNKIILEKDLKKYSIK